MAMSVMEARDMGMEIAHDMGECEVGCWYCECEARDRCLMCGEAIEGDRVRDGKEICHGCWADEVRDD